MVYGPFGQTGVMGEIDPKTVVMVQGGNDQLVSDAVAAAKAKTPAPASGARRT